MCMSGCASRPLRIPENTSVRMVTKVNTASTTCMALKRQRANVAGGFQPSRQRMITSHAAVSENTNHDCVESPSPSSSHSTKRSGDFAQRPSSHATAMNTTSSPQ